MNTFSHIRMALEINRTVKRVMKIKLDTAHFILGNIKPDMSPMLIKIPHLKEAAFDFISKEIKELMAQKISNPGDFTKSFSERLGVVTHYLSDFFCHAHSKGFTSSTLKHIVYEARLNRFLKKYPNLPRLCSFTGLKRMTDHKSICTFLDRLHIKYESKRPSFAKDYIYSLRACTALAVSVVASCMPAGLDMAA